MPDVFRDRLAHKSLTTSLAVAFLFSLLVNIFFDYRANKASRMNPIEALHYE